MTRPPSPLTMLFSRHTRTLGLVALASAVAVLAVAKDPDADASRVIQGVITGVGFLGTGAAMIPYSIIKEVNPDNAKGSATGAMNFLVFVMSALLSPALGWWLHKLAGGGPITLDHFVAANSVYVAAIVLAAILTLFLKETGSAVRAAH